MQYYREIEGGKFKYNVDDNTLFSLYLTKPVFFKDLNKNRFIEYFALGFRWLKWLWGLAGAWRCFDWGPSVNCCLITLQNAREWENFPLTCRPGFNKLTSGFTNKHWALKSKCNFCLPWQLTWLQWVIINLDSLRGRGSSYKCSSKVLMFLYF